jgi:hypothetical protein
LRHYEDPSRYNVAVAIAPDFDLENDATLELLEGGEWLDVDVVFRTCVHEVGGSLTVFFA